jgi:hypothetical protein
MAGWRKAIELAVGEEDLAALRGIARSRTEPASRVERARMLLAYRDEPSGDDPGQGMAGYGAERRSFRSRGDRPLRHAHHRPPRFDRHRIEGTSYGSAAPAFDRCVSNRRRGAIIYLHHGHRPALDRASVPFRQGSSASARGQAAPQTRDPGRDSPRRSQGAVLDRPPHIGPRSVVRRDRGERRQGGKAHSPAHATCVHPATYTGRDH